LVNKSIYYFKQAGIVVSLFCFILLTSCSDDNIVAQVDDSELLESDALVLMKHLGYNSNDKNDWKQFINLWCEQEVLRLELKNTDEEQSKLVKMRAQTFAGELSKYYLEEKAISLQLDSIISEKELLNYYNSNKENFSLQDYLVQALYIKVEKDTKVEKDLRENFLLKNDKDLSKVNSYAKLYAENFYFDDAQWIYFNDLTKDIPLKGYNRDNIVLNRTKTYFSDDEFTYFLNIIDYKLKNTSPPFEFLKPQIKEIILSQRINTLRDEIESKLIQNTKKKHEIKINL
jgi:hypothetical protein